MPHERRIRALRSAVIAAVIGALSLGSLLVGRPAAADDDISYGDVLSHFQAAEGAGSVIDQFAGPPAADLAGPATFFAHGIRPFVDFPWNGSSVCEDDWQLLVLSLIVGALEGDPPVKRDVGVVLLAPTTVDLYLDGIRLEDTERSPIKRLISGIAALEDGTIVEVTDGWWIQTGAFRAPGELTIGSHTFGAVITIPDIGEFALEEITFSVDASGTGSCL